MLEFWYTSDIYYFYYKWSSVTTTLCVQQSSVLQRTASGVFYLSSSMLSPQQLHLNSLMWSTGKGAGYISPMSFHRRNSPATTSNTESVHFLSDTTALLRDTIALPKWKQQLLFLPSVLSSCVCLLLPGIQQYPL